MNVSMKLVIAGVLTALAGCSANQMGDSQVLEVLRAVHQHEVDAGTLALGRTGSGPVKAFAQQMIDDHSAAIQREADIARRLALSPTPSTKSADLAKDGAESIDKLNQKLGPDFDRAYIDAMVDGHEHVLKLITDELLPAATSGELKSELMALQTAVKAHLMHAKTLKEAFAQL